MDRTGRWVDRSFKEKRQPNHQRVCLETRDAFGRFRLTEQPILRAKKNRCLNAASAPSIVPFIFGRVLQILCINFKGR